MRLSQRCKAISESVTLAIDAKAKAMALQGMDVIGFGAGEPDFDTPEHIRDAAKDALDKGFTRYTPVAGCLELRKAICAKLKRDNGLSYTPEQIVVSGGAKQCLFNAIEALVNPGEEVIVPAPYWVTYPELVRMAEGIPVFVETTAKTGYTLTAEAFEAAITGKTRVLILNTPGNPTGAVYDRKSLEAIAEVAVRHDIMVISDEIYEYLVYDGVEHISIASLGEDICRNTVVVNGLSKSYAMTGWRIGYTACDLALAKAMVSYQSHATSAINSITQYASIEALNGPQDNIREMVKQFGIRRQAMVKRIREIPGLDCLEPYGAFYVMLDIRNLIGKTHNGRKIEDTLVFAEMLLQEKQVAVVPGQAFAMEGFCRLCYTMDIQHIEEGLERIESFVRGCE